MEKLRRAENSPALVIGCCQHGEFNVPPCHFDSKYTARQDGAVIAARHDVTPLSASAGQAASNRCQLCKYTATRCLPSITFPKFFLGEDGLKDWLHTTLPY